MSKMYTYSSLINPDSSYSIQQTIVNDSIILQGLVQYENDDSKALGNIIRELKESEDMLSNLQKNIGKSNYKSGFKRSKMILSHKYSSDENLKTAYLNNFNVLTKPKELTREINKKYKDIKYKDEIFEKYKKLTKRHLFRRYDCYSCIYNQNSVLVDSYEADSEYNLKRPDLESKLKEWDFEYKIKCVDDCPYKEICTTQLLNKL